MELLKILIHAKYNRTRDNIEVIKTRLILFLYKCKTKNDGNKLQSLTSENCHIQNIYVMW